VYIVSWEKYQFFKMCIFILDRLMNLTKQGHKILLKVKFILVALQRSLTLHNGSNKQKKDISFA